MRVVMFHYDQDSKDDDVDSRRFVDDNGGDTVSFEQAQRRSSP